MYQYTRVVWDYYLPWGCCFANRNHCMITTVIRYLATWKVFWNHLRIPFIFWQKNIKTNGDASKSLVHFLNCFSVAACVFVIDLCSSTVVSLVLRFLKIKAICTQILLWIYIYIYIYMFICIKLVWGYYLAWGYCFANQNQNLCMTTRYLVKWKWP